MLSQTQQVSIFELAIYALLIPLTLFVLVRHGNQGILGWIYLNLFEALRLAGAGLTIGDSTSTGVLIINAVGLSPLLLANAGVIREMYVPDPRSVEAVHISPDKNVSVWYEADTSMAQEPLRDTGSRNEKATHHCRSARPCVGRDCRRLVRCWGREPRI